MPPQQPSQFQSSFIQNNNVPPPIVPPVQPKKKRSFGLYFILAVILVVLAAIFLLWQAKKAGGEIYEAGNSIVNVPVNPLADWQTYTNGKYGYEFKYPSDWSAATNANNDGNALFGVESTSTAGTAGVEYLGKLKDGQSLEDFITKFNKGVESGALSESTSTVNGQNVVISIMPHAGTPETESKSVAFENNSQVFNVYINYHSDIGSYPEDKTSLDTFDKILPTFKFVSTSTPSTISTSTPNTSTSTPNATNNSTSTTNK